MLVVVVGCAFYLVVLIMLGVDLVLVRAVLKADEMEHYNRLKYEKSPYLSQHKDNPVWWYAWGAEAFKAARQQDKPMRRLSSIKLRSTFSRNWMPRSPIPITGMKSVVVGGALVTFEMDRPISSEPRPLIASRPTFFGNWWTNIPMSRSSGTIWPRIQQTWRYIMRREG